MKKQKFSVTVVLLSALLAGGAGEECLAIGRAVPDPQSRDTRYHFLLFWKQTDAATSQARQTLGAFASQREGQLIVSDIHVGDPAQRDLVKQYGVSRAPMPLVLAIAPNGAVTTAITHPIENSKLAGAIVSPASADCIKGIQDGKIVFVCVHSKQMLFTKAALEGVYQFAADDNYREATHITHVDPTDAREIDLLRQMKIDPQTISPVTVMLAPSGGMLGKYEGATTKVEFVSSLTASQSSGCPGGKCGPGGCSPKK